MTSQHSFWLNALASTNMSSIHELHVPLRQRVRPADRELEHGQGDRSVTLAVFHLLISWLNALASLNMVLMSVTAAVSQSPIDWLNALAS